MAAWLESTKASLRASVEAAMKPNLTVLLDKPTITVNKPELTLTKLTVCLNNLEPVGRR